MNESRVICNGNELSQVLSDIRFRGGFVEALETGIGGRNANYRVSYLQRMTEEPQSVPGRNRNAGHAVPAALTIGPDVGHKQNQSTKQRRWSGYADNAGEVVMLKQTSRSGDPGERRHMPNNCVTAGETAISIEDRLAALKSKVEASGKLKRIKPSTNEARLPYRDT